MFGKRSKSTAVVDGLPDIYPRLWRYCLVLTRARDLADDLAQAAALRAIEKRRQFKPGTHLDRWIFTIAKRLWLNDRRSAAVRRGHGTIDVADAGLADESADAEMNISVAEVLSQIDQLPAAQSECILLVYVEGFSYREAAELMDIPIGTVMSRLCTARRTIMSALSKEEDEKDV